MRLRAFLTVTLVALAELRCSSTSSVSQAVTGLPPGTEIRGAGVVDPGWLRDRKLDWVRFETKEFHPGSIANVVAHMVRKRLEPGYVPPGAVPASAWDAMIQNMDALNDGRDFDALYMMSVLLGFGDDPMIPPELKQKVDDALTRFKFWYTDAAPPGSDDSYYWTENHQALYHTIEYLIGLRHEGKAIGSDARLGADHAKDARGRLLAWLEHRLRFGFSEWHSNVYYQKDLVPLLTLVDFAPDEAVRARAAMVLDLLFFDLATHTLKDAFGVTHGRSYKKDKMQSTDEDTWGTTKLLFGQSTYDYLPNDGGAALFAASQRYEYPEIIRRAGADAGPMVDRERLGIPIQETLAADGDPIAPFGFSYQNHDDLMVWWGMGALTTYPVVPETLAEFEKYDLWSNNSFAQLASFRTLASSPAFAQNLSASSAAMVNFGLLREVDTYTYRNADVMLSSAIDYRKGTFNQQMHSWQATLDAKALVFTNHPFRALATSGDWLDDPENGGYWNGEASAPRSAQTQNVAIHVYAPQYAKTNAPPFDYFHWEPYTHAYFPQDYFDEVVQKRNWTFGRLGKGYVALYSWRAPTFLVYDGTTQATGGRIKPFDLLADGGADNVWIVEVAREADAGSFPAFQDAIAAANVQVTSRGPGKPTGESDGFDVVYDSPSQGHITFGWEAPLVARGQEVPLRGAGRFDNPWAHVPTDPPEIVVEQGGVGFHHDVLAGHRLLYGP